MIVIYDVTDKCIKQREFYNELQNLNVTNISNFEIRFEALGMCELLVDALDLIVNSNSKPIVCKASFCEKYLVEINCIDCGDKAAKWISRCVFHNFAATCGILHYR